MSIPWLCRLADGESYLRVVVRVLGAHNSDTRAASAIPDAIKPMCAFTAKFQLNCKSVNVPLEKQHSC